MRCEYAIQVASIDGQTFFEFHSNKAAECLTFLSRYDHEGSSVSLRIECFNDDVYEMLRKNK